MKYGFYLPIKTIDSDLLNSGLGRSFTATIIAFIFVSLGDDVLLEWNRNHIGDCLGITRLLNKHLFQVLLVHLERHHQENQNIKIHQKQAKLYQVIPIQVFVCAPNLVGLTIVMWLDTMLEPLPHFVGHQLFATANFPGVFSYC